MYHGTEYYAQRHEPHRKTKDIITFDFRRKDGNHLMKGELFIMKNIIRNIICIALIVALFCSTAISASAYSGNPDSAGKVAFGCSYYDSFDATKPYKNWIDVEYETKVGLIAVQNELDAAIAFAQTLGTSIPVEIIVSSKVAWNNGVVGCDAIGTAAYKAVPAALTAPVNGSTTTTSTATLIEFDDVYKTDWYYDAVLWGANAGIAAGTGNNKFSPDLTCTHAQILTFIYRYLGSPAPSVSSMPYGNVKSSDYFYNAVLWAYGKGVVNGKTFNPDALCTRADTVTYLYRTAVSNPSTSPADTGFTDVDRNAAYAQAVLWASSNGIVNGTGNGKFSPDDTCTRGTIITILHRYAGNPAPSAGSTTNTVGYKYAPDVPDSYKYAEAINYCIENRLFKLNADGSFNPESTPGAYELSKLFTRIIGWRFADSDFSWTNETPADADPDLVNRAWRDWNSTQRYQTRTESAYDFKCSPSDPEPYWFKDVAAYEGDIWANYTRTTREWVESGEVTVTVFLNAFNFFQGRAAKGYGLDVNQMRAAISIASDDTRPITLGEVCQVLYEYSNAVTASNIGMTPLSYGWSIAGRQPLHLSVK